MLLILEPVAMSSSTCTTLINPALTVRVEIVSAGNKEEHVTLGLVVVDNPHVQ